MLVITTRCFITSHALFCGVWFLSNEEDEYFVLKEMLLLKIKVIIILFLIVLSSPIVYGQIEEMPYEVQMEKDIKRVLDFINTNISLITKEQATQMISEFEHLQRNFLSSVEEKFYNDDLQQRIYNIYRDGFDLSKINDIDEINKLEAPDLRGLLRETRNNGYKVETAEGMFFPIIDYQFYQQYSSYLTTDMAEYIKVMSVESNQVPAKDGALVIGWDEVLHRALSQEEFITQHPDSIKAVDVERLYRKYLIFIFYGLNNTPLFSYESKTMVAEARCIYSEMVDSNQFRNSSLLESIKEFLKLLETNNYKLTDEVEKYRKGAIECELKSSKREKLETIGDYKIKDNKVVFDFQLVNNFTQTRELQFSSGQQFEIIITNEKGKEVYRYSDGKAFTMALVYKSIKPGELLKWQDEWNMINKEGERLSSGEYQAKISVLATSLEKNEKRAESRLTTIVSFDLGGIIKSEDAE